MTDLLDQKQTSEEKKKANFQVSFYTREGHAQEGPMALLWKLIESYEVDIFEVSLSRITEDFIGYIKTGKVSLEEESDFALMASRLLNYKSKQLLPNPGFETDHEPDALPVELVDQLLEYKKFQMAADWLREIEESAQMSYSIENRWDEYEKDLDYLQVDMISFLKVFKEFLLRSESPAMMEIEEEDISIENVMEELSALVLRENKVSFFHYVQGVSLFRLIVVFLAVLELIRLKLIRAVQKELFQDIELVPFRAAVDSEL